MCRCAETEVEVPGNVERVSINVNVLCLGQIRASMTRVDQHAHVIHTICTRRKEVRALRLTQLALERQRGGQRLAIPVC